MEKNKAMPNSPYQSTHATLVWQDTQPFSPLYQDVYFSTDNGLLETDYVFLQGNALTTRWQTANLNHFTIMETGFGTGLNFLSAVKLWQQVAPQHATLHFISVEKHPLHPQDLQAALALWPSLSPLSDALLARYPQLLLGEPIALLNQRVQLTLLIGDALTALSQVPYQADAWFLDGFSPAKNPAMWQPALFMQMAKHSHQNATFATFTSAGAVRRGLMAAGFTVQKRTGFGKKREMLHGRLSTHA